MEVIIWLAYIFTLLVQIIKSRFINIGRDLGYQFEEKYLSYLFNFIIDYVKMDTEANQ